MTVVSNAVSVRLPPVAVFTQELHAAYGCRVGWVANGMLRLVFMDLAADTMLAWERWLFPHLTELHLRARLERHFYDMRQVTQPTLAGLQTAVRVNQNVGVRWTRTAVLANTSPMLAAIQVVIHTIPNANARLFSDEFEAVRWLNQPGAK